ncbi:hypothetical protein [Paraflavitalea pollutisoli]|uniref:hypothetical protein n=1 Tax=Paraflavitalea pollutisoli TaxID=3034143 RepID=UPI0023ED3CAC|nr:hypothetical protein [Paraflavitalea sp. H1-2-19X]
MSLRTKYRKPIAAFMLVIVATQTLLPATALALTSGPVQPEVSTFKPAGVTDMVDMFTGNFSYNLPLLDIDGYPINLSYQSGMGNDDEASWAGFGWNVNIGSINRQVRGVPDDFSGDRYTTDQFTKPNVTVGGKLTGTLETAGFPFGFSTSGSLAMGIFSNNYTGIGAELGANAGLKWTDCFGVLTGEMGYGVTSKTSSGVDVQKKFSLQTHLLINDNTLASPGIAGTSSYNSRGGLKERTLGATFSLNEGAANDVYGKSTSFNTPAINPSIKLAMKSSHGSATFNTGPTAWFIFAGGGITGYVTKNEVKDRDVSTPAYGFLYADRGKNRADAMMDLLREKENPIIPELPNLAVPVATPDLFSYTSQAGTGQFRLYRGGSGILFDNEATDESLNQTLGLDGGFGFGVHTGVNLFNQTMSNKGGKWVKDNQFMANGDFQSPSDNPKEEHVFFKQVGEMSQEDEALVQKMKGTEPVAVDIVGRNALSRWRTASGTPTNVSSIKKVEKERRKTAISYLTAEEASKVGLDKQIQSYKAIGDQTIDADILCHKGQVDPPKGRTDGLRRRDHISEITVTDEAGKRNVYGIPVYNKTQKDISYAIGKKNGEGGYVSDDNNLVTVALKDNLKVKQSEHADNDNYLRTETQPAYASSYLLSGILSPDYVDVTGDGITDDDLGTAIKFNYTYAGDYKWRTPFGLGEGQANKATVAKASLADPDDDKGSFIYGEKELWYPHSIETKTKIAFFITENRYDAMGVEGVVGTHPAGTPQKRLKEIRLYSKADPNRPIKIVRLKHDYSLFPKVPNFNVPETVVDKPLPGKLTLLMVEFLYGNSPKGSNHPYKFTYNLGMPGQPDAVQYGFMQTDRWGTYKPRDANTSINSIPLKNDQHPYTIQGTATDDYVGVWQLKQIDLPTGGSINVSYESDSYSYVQNRRAMELVKVDKVIKNTTGGEATGVKEIVGVRVIAPGKPLTNSLKEFCNNFLNGSSYIFTRMFVHMGGLDPAAPASNDDFYDFVPCYAKIVDFRKVSADTYDLIFETLSDGGVTMNPIQQAAYQKLKTEYPRYAYNGYKNRVSVNNVGKAIEAAVGAIASSAKNLKELTRNFYETAEKKGWANQFKLEKSFVRLAKWDGPKKGGGLRVKKIMISDNWATMSGNNNNLTRTYGQEYKYEFGVASNEPSIGNDENPLKMPVPYMQYVKKGLNNYFNLEEPFGEYYFPAPTVGYGKVTVQDLNKDGVADPAKRTGYVVNEFYTAKDFPVITNALSNKLNQQGPSGWYSFFGGWSVHEMTFSQGYVIELNDMHGKPKAVRVFNRADMEVSSSEFKYLQEMIGADEWKLRNEVTVIDKNGQIEENKVIGREIELFTDMRQQESSTIGENVMLGMDLIYAIFIGGPFPHFPYKHNDDYRLFRSACTMKVINRYGIVEKVIKKENGSTINADNLVFDAATGQPLVTRSQNEFGDPVYTVNFPAYWMHPSMGAAYQNLGTVLSGFKTTATGAIENNTYANFLQPGDELVSLSVNGSSDRYWIIESATSTGGAMTKKLVDRYGKLVEDLSGQDIKVIRSGYRNVLGAAAANIVCLKDPIVIDPATGKKRLSFSKNEELAAWKVLTASAVNFDENWSTGAECLTCDPGYVLNEDGECERLPIENNDVCFNLVPGSRATHYGMDGALIYKTNNSAPETRKSFFWGGSCACPSGNDLLGNTAESQSLAETKLVDSTQNQVISTSAQSTAIVTPNASTGCVINNTPNQSDCNLGFCGRLNESGIWLYKGNANDVGWVGVEFCVEVPEPGDYYIGFGADQKMVITINTDDYDYSMPADNPSNRNNWHVRPYNFPYKKNKVLIEFASESGVQAAGFEVYNKTYEELIQAGLNLTTKEEIIFSTARDLLGKRVQVYRDHPNPPHTRLTRYSCPIPIAGYSACEGCGKYELDRVVNPYVKGAKGNWRPNETKVFQVDRNHNDLFNEQKKGADIRNSGTFASFKPYWYLDGQSWKPNTAVQNWVTANTVTVYDKYGQELENKDALGRYSAASFSFLGQLPNAVASNARSREIFFESFEDTKFKLCPTPEDLTACYRVALKNGSGDLKPDIANLAHSGNYSLTLKAAGLTLDTRAHYSESKEWPYLFTNTKGEFTLTPEPTVFPLGFEPMPKMEYVFSAWVKEEQPSVNTSLPITLSINGFNIILKRKAYVEKWSLIEGTFTMPDLVCTEKANVAVSIAILPNGGDKQIDDIRIHPFASLMKTYAYDAKTLRLMAEMDENAFATFYEYDNEGGLVRVKKETERGILTIKESRSSQKKK